jgi:uncharacterized protein
MAQAMRFALGRHKVRGNWPSALWLRLTAERENRPIMKPLLITFCLLFAAGLVNSQNINPAYDSTLAAALGADDYGMKRYVLAILKTGSNTEADQATIQRCFAGHLENIRRLADEGKLIVAGPLGKNGQAYRGIFIFDVATLEEAEELLQTDPAIEAKLLAADLYPWYGSAALPEYLPAADKIWKLKP